MKAYNQLTEWLIKNLEFNDKNKKITSLLKVKPIIEMF